MDKPKTTPKDFFLWAGAMIALYVAVFNYIALVWNYIDFAIPDPLQPYFGDPYQNGISWEMASLIVLVPVFLILMWLIHRDIKKDPARRGTWVRRWALFLTVFLAGVTVVIDFIWILYAFLNGTDLTGRFLLKALIVLFVAAIGFMHFLADLWNYWEIYPTRNRSVGIATVALVVITIIAGFFVVGTPAQARFALFDEQKVSDLQTIQSQIVNYWQSKQELPAALADLNDPLSNFRAPVDPQAGDAYSYQATGALSFKLCATFNAEGSGALSETAPVAPAPASVGSAGQAIADNWQHGAGTVCFDRTIDPQRYPPISKTIIQ
jgi:hypothetical protein